MRHLRLHYRRQLTPLGAFVGTVGVLTALVGGCLRPEETHDVHMIPTANAGATVGAGGGAATTGVTVSGTGAGTQNYTAPEFFDKFVEPDIKQFCSGTACHSGGDIEFLTEGFEYYAVKLYRTTQIERGSGFITADPEQSLLLTYPAGNEHSGISYSEKPTTEDKVRAWLELEAEALGTPVQNEIGPYLVRSGVNSFPLDQISSAFSGGEIFFYATETPNSLTITDLQIFPVGDGAIRIANPTVRVYVPGDLVGDPDTTLHAELPTDYVYPSATLVGTGEVTLTWKPGSRLSFELESIKTLFADGQGNTYEECNDVEKFIEASEFLVQSKAPPIPKGNGPIGCAKSCHGGAVSDAFNAMDLSGLTDDPIKWDYACAVMRTQIVSADIDESPIVKITDPTAPGEDGHTTYRFGGSVSAHSQFKDGMKAWVDAE